MIQRKEDLDAFHAEGHISLTYFLHQSFPLSTNPLYREQNKGEEQRGYVCTDSELLFAEMSASSMSPSKDEKKYRSTRR